MGWFSKQPDKPEPYAWPFLKEACLQALDARVHSTATGKSPLDQLNYDRLTASGDDAEEVVIVIWAMLEDAKNSGLSTMETQKYLYLAAQTLRTDVGPSEAIERLKKMETSSHAA